MFRKDICKPIGSPHQRSDKPSLRIAGVAKRSQGSMGWHPSNFHCSLTEIIVKQTTQRQSLQVREDNSFGNIQVSIRHGAKGAPECLSTPPSSKIEPPELIAPSISLWIPNVIQYVFKPWLAKPSGQISTKYPHFSKNLIQKSILGTKYHLFENMT